MQSCDYNDIIALLTSRKCFWRLKIQKVYSTFDKKKIIATSGLCT